MFYDKLITRLPPVAKQQCFPSSSSFSNAAKGGWAAACWSTVHLEVPASVNVTIPPPSANWPRDSSSAIDRPFMCLQYRSVCISDDQAQNLNLYCVRERADNRAGDCTVGDTINNNTSWGVTKWDEDSVCRLSVCMWELGRLIKEVW